jgi:hypothetical protein
VKRFALIALLVLVTAGWGSCTPVLRRGVPAQCDAIGFQECKSQAKWEGDPADPKAWDQLAGETLPASREETRTCETRRKALEQCLRRLDKQHVIDLGGAR